MNKFSFSVFTPVYNRGGVLNKVYDSLSRQTYKNFEWIIVNDGSTDNTDSVINNILKQSNLPVKYINFENNCGKHVAQNRALDVAEGKLFVPLDSDDYIVPEALEIFWQAWNSIPEDEQNEYSGVGVHCMDQNGIIVGTLYPYDRMISNDLDMAFKYKVKGEKWGMIRTDIMREFKNLEVKGHFLSESTVWFRIAQKYPKKLYLQKALRVYEVHEDSVMNRNKPYDYNIESTIVQQRPLRESPDRGKVLSGSLLRPQQGHRGQPCPAVLH